MTHGINKKISRMTGGGESALTPVGLRVPAPFIHNTGGEMVIKAKYSGRCRDCGGQIKKGQEIEWSREGGARHIKCPEREHAPYQLYGGSGYGCDGWVVGQTLRSSQRHQSEGWPEYITVVRSESRYFPEDGLSFGVGDEDGYTYTADCRAATESEAAPVRIRIAAREVKKSALKRLAEIKNQIQETGERPEGIHQPEGEIILDTQTIYGGGDWFVINPENIWYVRNNGADGDNWSCNNVRTGGAGAIGWKIPNNPTVADEIRKIAEIIKCEIV